MPSLDTTPPTQRETGLGAGLARYCLRRRMRRPSASTGEADQLEAAVLSRVWATYPLRRTIPALVQEMLADLPDAPDDAGLERAIVSLVGHGRLRCESGYVVPTPLARKASDN